jgi:hypothetical protein
MGRRSVGWHEKIIAPPAGRLGRAGAETQG